MPTRITEPLSLMIGVGSARGDYVVPKGRNQVFDIGDRFSFPRNAKVLGAWYQPTDVLSQLPRFRGINVSARPSDTDVDLTLHGGEEDAEMRISVFALYEVP